MSEFLKSVQTHYVVQLISRACEESRSGCQLRAVTNVPQTKVLHVSLILGQLQLSSGHTKYFLLLISYLFW